MRDDQARPIFRCRARRRINPNLGAIILDTPKGRRNMIDEKLLIRPSPELILKTLRALPRPIEIDMEDEGAIRRLFRVIAKECRRNAL